MHTHLTETGEDERIQQGLVIEDGVEIAADFEDRVEVEDLALELTVGLGTSSSSPGFERRGGASAGTGLAAGSSRRAR